MPCVSLLPRSELKARLPKLGKWLHNIDGILFRISAVSCSFTEISPREALSPSKDIFSGVVSRIPDEATDYIHTAASRAYNLCPCYKLLVKVRFAETEELRNILKQSSGGSVDDRLKMFVL